MKQIEIHVKAEKETPLTGSGAPEGNTPAKTPRARGLKVGGKKRKATKTTRHGNGSSGPGIGGPANGSGRGKTRALLEAAGPGRGHFSIEGEAKKEARERRANAFMEILWDIAHDPEEVAAARVTASVHALNRLQGMPVQTLVAATTDDLTDDERDRQIEAFRRTILEPALPHNSLSRPLNGVEDCLQLRAESRCDPPRDFN